MKTIKIYYFIILGIFLLSSCKKEVDDFALSETVFIEDAYFPGLPIYSEWGYNTFGAYIDRKPFVSTSFDLPAKVFVNSDTLHIQLRGSMDYTDVDLKISIKGYSPATHYDLLELNKKTINLKDTTIAVILKIGNESHKLKLIEGEIIFQKVQLLYLDGQATRTLMSGYFQLKTFLNNEPIAISNGRFDLGIGYENFFNY